MAQKWDAGADEFVLTGHVQAPVGRTGGHDHRVRGELLPGRQRGDQVIAVTRQAADRHRRQQLHPVPADLRHETVGQLAAGDALGEAGVVVDPVADGGLAAERAVLNHDGVDALPGRVDGRGQPGGSASDDDQVVGRPVGLEGEADAAGQRLVARVHLVRPVRVDHGRDGPATACSSLTRSMACGSASTSTLASGPGGPPGTSDPPAVRAPCGPVHRHDRLIGRDHNSLT